MSKPDHSPEVQEHAPRDSSIRYRLLHPHLNLAGTVAIAITAAACIVIAAYSMYSSDSNRKYDIARPGDKTDNQVLTVENDEADTTSAVTPTAAKKKLDDLTREVNDLNALGRFDAEDLSDQSLQLTPPDQPSF